MLAEGTLTKTAITKELGIDIKTLWRWEQNPEFLEKRDQFTLEHELATRAGLMREAFRGLNLKRPKIQEDKSTHLDYLKELSELAGLRKQRVELQEVDSERDRILRWQAARDPKARSLADNLLLRLVELQDNLTAEETQKTEGEEQGQI